MQKKIKLSIILGEESGDYNSNFPPIPHLPPDSLAFSDLQCVYLFPSVSCIVFNVIFVNSKWYFFFLLQPLISLFFCNLFLFNMMDFIMFCRNFGIKGLGKIETGFQQGVRGVVFGQIYHRTAIVGYHFTTSAHHRQRSVLQPPSVRFLSISVAWFSPSFQTIPTNQNPHITTIY